jgi:hypothetical protein
MVMTGWLMGIEPIGADIDIDMLIPGIGIDMAMDAVDIVDIAGMGIFIDMLDIPGTGIFIDIDIGVDMGGIGMFIDIVDIADMGPAVVAAAPGTGTYVALAFGLATIMPPKTPGRVDRVDGHHHAGLAVLVAGDVLRAVDGHGVGVVDGDAEDLGLREVRSVLRQFKLLSQ